MPSELEKGIYTTVQYFGVLRMPVTATQIWWCAVGEFTQQKRWKLRDVQETLRVSTWLQERVGQKDGYVYTKGSEHLVRTRLQRHRIAQQKWKLTMRAATILSWAPFIKGLAGSGSLAIDNTKQTSDLDLFVITTPRRIWTARLFLLGVSQLLGRRRKHWNTSAPDMICLNHYVSTEGLTLSPVLHNPYTAALYALLIPVYGSATVRMFQQANRSWMKNYVTMPPVMNVLHRYTIATSHIRESVKGFAENFLLEPIGDVFEAVVERIQRALIAKHTTGRPGRIALSSQELAFHPDTKAPHLIKEFDRRSKLTG